MNVQVYSDPRRIPFDKPSRLYLINSNIYSSGIVHITSRYVALLTVVLPHGPLCDRFANTKPSDKRESPVLNNATRKFVVDDIKILDVDVGVGESYVS